MALSTVFGDNAINLGDNTLVFGTCMLGTAFGEVKSASLKRTADRDLIASCLGNLRAVLLKNPRFELTLKTVFDSAITPPGLLEVITLPLVSLAARILDISVDWEQGGERQLSIEAARWDALGSANAYTFDGSAYTLIE